MALRRRVQRATESGPELSPLSESEIEWRDRQLKAAQLIAKRYSGDCDDLPSLGQLDRVVDGWLDDDTTRIDVNVLINAVGIAFGQHLANDTGMSWVIATDTKGSDLALHRARGDVLIYPANAVAKRVVAQQRQFVGSLHQALTADIGPG